MRAMCQVQYCGETQSCALSFLCELHVSTAFLCQTLCSTAVILGLYSKTTTTTIHLTGQTIPHLNFSIASEWLQPLWQHLQWQLQVRVPAHSACPRIWNSHHDMRESSVETWFGKTGLQDVGGLEVFDTAQERLVRLWTLQPFMMMQPENLISKL
jgi:hypothetical protein